MKKSKTGYFKAFMNLGAVGRQSTSEAVLGALVMWASEAANQESWSGEVSASASAWAANEL